MKKLSAIILAVLLTASVFAQTPEKISYQAVIRNSSGALVTNTQIGMQINIRQGSASGTIVYTETQTPTTNVNGLVNIEIGGASGFSAINWASNTYYIETKIAIVSPLTTYTITGVSQLLSVPYALHANTAAAAAETDPTWSGTANLTSDIYRTGKVGIGTTSPVYSLDIVGAARCSGFGSYGFNADMYSDLSPGWGGHFTNTNYSGNGSSGGVYAEGKYTGTFNSGETYGGCFKATSTTQNCSGVKGLSYRNTGSSSIDYSKGVYGYGNMPGTAGSTYGVEGKAYGGLNAFGIYGSATGATNNWAGYFDGKVTITGTLKITDGSQGAGKVLTSDATGNGTWETPVTASESDPTWNGTANQTGDIGRTGNVGIGTSTPTTKLEVNGTFKATGNTSKAFEVINTATSNTSYSGYFTNASTDGRGLYSKSTATTGSTTAGYFVNESTTGVGINSYANATSGNSLAGYFENKSTSGTGIVSYASATSGTTYGIRSHVASPDGYSGYFYGGKFFIGGNVGIGTDTPAELLHVKNAAGSAKMRLQSTDVSTIEFYNNTAYMAGIGINVSQGHFFIYNGGNISVKDGSLGINNVAPAQKLDITAGNGRVQSGYSWLTNSDVRYKTNITTIENALQRITRLRGVRYDLKEDKTIVQGQGKHIGFIAQELEIEFPEFVVTDNNGYKSVAYDKMTAVLLQAINEQQTDIQQLKQLVEQQQVQIKTLINKIDQSK